MEKRPHYGSDIIKIAITGPESTGKSTLSAQLAKKYNTLWVPEYAREYISEKEGNYEESDLLHIANQQYANEQLFVKDANKILFCDTEMLVIKIWSMVKYERCHPEIIQKLKTQNFSHYLLCDIDILWQEDPLREHPHFREQLFSMYEQELKHYNFPYTIIQGDGDERLNLAVNTINLLTDLRH